MPQQNSTSTDTPLARAEAFCRRFGLRVPILQAPMAGASPIGLAAAVANGGGMGALGALMTPPDGIAGWASQFHGQSNGTFQINLWVPDPAPVRDAGHEARLRDFLGEWGPPVPPEMGDAKPLDFEAQCAALLAAGPQVVSTIMGLFPDKFVAELKARGVAWFACATTKRSCIRPGPMRSPSWSPRRRCRPAPSPGGSGDRSRPIMPAPPPRRRRRGLRPIRCSAV